MLPMDIAQLIAANIESARKLEGFLTRLSTESQLKNQQISEELVKALLGKVVEVDLNRRPTTRPKDILKIFSNYFNVKSSNIQGPSRLKSLVLPRHLAMYVLRTELKLSLEEIGSLFNRRDHTTVMHAVDKVTKGLMNLVSQYDDFSPERYALMTYDFEIDFLDFQTWLGCGLLPVNRTLLCPSDAQCLGEV